MEINYTRDAFDSLSALLLFIEKENTKGAGIRWLDKFESFLIETLPLNDVITYCNNKTFHQLKLKCLNYNDWIIAFTVNDETINIEAILHKSRLKD